MPMKPPIWWNVVIFSFTDTIYMSAMSQLMLFITPKFL